VLIKAATSATFVECANALDANGYVDFRVVNASGAAVAPGAVGDEISFIIDIMTVRLSPV